MIIIDLFFSPHSIYTQRITMDLFQFRVGVASYLVSNDQVVSEISDALGLGEELYVNKKKVDMLQDPSAYLLQRNKVLLKSATGMSNIYEELMKDVVKAIAGTSDKESDEYKVAAGQLWVKSLV